MHTFFHKTPDLDLFWSSLQIDEGAGPYANPCDLEDSESWRNSSKLVLINDEYIVLKTIGQGSFGKVGKHPRALFWIFVSYNMYMSVST